MKRRPPLAVNASTRRDHLENKNQAGACSIVHRPPYFYTLCF
jgi:hypothetical protein